MGFSKGYLIVAAAALLAGCAPNYGPGSGRAANYCYHQAMNGYYSSDANTIGTEVLGPAYMVASGGVSSLDQASANCMQSLGYHVVSN